MLRASTIAFGKRVALIFSGCGVKDGTEIHEATSMLIHLDRRGIKYDVFTPDHPQYHVYNHQADDEAKGEMRMMADEAARINRGPVKSIKDLKAENYDALLMPGGFGVMKNLCDYGVKGKDGSVRPCVFKAVHGFHKSGKPIGAACIAPVILAATIKGCTITLGSATGEPQDLCRSFGATVIECAEDKACVDEGLKLVTAPAYMYDTTPSKVYDSIGALVAEVEKLMKK